MTTRFHCLVLILVLGFACGVASDMAAAGDQSMNGAWSFELPDGRPAWLQIGEEDGEVTAALLWSVGSAKPCEVAVSDDGKVAIHRRIRWKFGGDDSEPRAISEPMIAEMTDDGLQLTVHQTNEATGDEETFVLAGKRIPPMPPRPDLTQVTFGEPVQLFNGRDLTGWRLADPKKTNGWKAIEGVLVNNTPKTDFGAYGSYGNLCTDDLFEDFELTIEYNVPAGGNSGIYLRGMYEAQVVDRDSRMQGIQGPGAIFGRIAPSKNAGKPGGQWNRYVLTLVDRHITVVLNGEKVIDNQPLVGCTGGGILSDDTRPGPIFLQGDHTSIQYRNITLRPVVE